MIIACILAMGFNISAWSASEPDRAVEVQDGPGHPMSPHSGCWIWADQDGPADSWMCFRHVAVLASVPQKAVATIAADSTYWLWVNGRSVVHCGGLKRGPTPSDTYADQVDLAPYLHAGENHLAALVWYYGISGSSHVDSGKGGFLLDAPLDNVSTSATWRVRCHPAFSSHPDGMGSWRPCGFETMFARMDHPPSGARDVLVESPIRFDARCDSQDWQTAALNADWAHAVEKGKVPIAPWGLLFPRPIPMFRRGDQTIYRNQSEWHLPCDGPVTLTGILPANLQVLPNIRLSARPGIEVRIKAERSHRGTVYVTRNGEQEFEVPAWGNGHSVTYDIPSGVRVLGCGYRETGYDVDRRGYFRCDDMRLETLWEKCHRSIYVNMRDGFMDCPDRERSSWPGDLVNTGASIYYLFDARANQLVGKSIREIVNWKTPGGIIWGAVPTGRFPGSYREFPVQSLAVIAVALPHYVEQTGDLGLAASALPAFEQYLTDCWKMADDGLPEMRRENTDWGSGTARWMDWGRGGVDRRLLETAWYAWAIAGTEHVRTLANAPANIGLAHRLRLITSAFDRVFWNQAVQAYRSPGVDGEPDDRGNALAICAGLAPAERRTALAAMLRRVRLSSIYMERYVIEALCDLGCHESAMRRMLERYEEAISDAYSTLPENFGEHSNHGWGAWPASVIARHIAGISPLSPGYKTMAIAPNPTFLRRFDIRYSCGRGEVAVSWDDAGGRATLSVACPEGSRAELTFPMIDKWKSIDAGGATMVDRQRGRLVVGPGKWRIVGTAEGGHD